jgi:1-pyrroline-5-carboxylate dehydrogenase
MLLRARCTAARCQLSSPLLLRGTSIVRKMSSRSFIPEPYNETMRSYPPGSDDAKHLKAACERLKRECPDIPCVVGGREIRTGDVKKQVMPSKHTHAVCTFHQANKDVVKQAIDSAVAARESWEMLPFEHRAAVFLKTADLISHKYRYDILAATMLGQGKTVWQAEIDAAAEVVDFLRFNTKYAEQIYEMQPSKNSTGVWNRSEYRALEGYVVAISPFNFTAIGANLPTAPALMGNVVVWKPSSTAVLSNWVFFKAMREAGLPDGVINFIPGAGSVIGDVVFNHRDFAGVHFTGSTGTFNDIMFKTAQNMKNGLYRSYPRMVGETGGKDFHFVHSSADVVNAAFQTVRAAFEYQGQKCSACSRAYVPDNLWPAFRDIVTRAVAEVPVGQSDDFKSGMSAVIDRNSFNNIKSYIERARQDPSCEIVAGGTYSDAEGFFVNPTVVVVKDPKSFLMQEEIFGPVLTIYVYPAAAYEETLRVCDETSPYSLTGSIFALDRSAIELANKRLRNAAGNFYINDKCTGAIVGQQPFGGARASGTNDKAGSLLNLLRWTSARTIKENYIHITGFSYPHMG